MIDPEDAASARLASLPPSVKRVIERAMADWGLDAEDFFGPCRETQMVNARGIAARQLRRLGFSVYAIAKMIGRNHKTVSRYARPELRKRKNDKARSEAERWKAFQLLSPGIADIVLDIAKAEGVSFAALAAEWIAERAQYEAEAKARAA